MDDLNQLIEQIKVLQQQINDARTALAELLDMNPLHNDFDAYQYHVCEWGLGEIPERPTREGHGLKSATGRGEG